MREVSWSLTALMLMTAACGNNDPVGSSQPSEEMTNNPATAGKDGGGRRDGGRDAGNGSSGTKKDGGGTTPVDPETGCGRSAFTTGSVFPDMLIVLDRSGSMKPTGGNNNLRCDGNPDIFTALQCSFMGINCNSAQDAMTTYCGGTQIRGPVDRWTPSVSAVKTLTSRFQSEVAFGLMTFPARSNECGPGDFQVPIDLGTADMIANVLDRTNPGGGTPTGQTLEAALQYFQENSAPADAVKPAQYVLLVTDGQPTCPNSNGGNGNTTRLNQDKQYTIDAIDKLTEAGIKTFVVGYDASLDQSLSDALREFAQHGGTEDYYPVQNEDSLVDAFTKISEVVVTCAFEFKKRIDDPSLLRVTLDGVTLKPNDPNGWLLDGQTITIQGSSCETLQNEGSKHHVEIALECEPVIYL